MKEHNERVEGLRAVNVYVSSYLWWRRRLKWHENKITSFQTGSDGKTYETSQSAKIPANSSLSWSQGKVLFAEYLFGASRMKNTTMKEGLRSTFKKKGNFLK